MQWIPPILTCIHLAPGYWNMNYCNAISLGWPTPNLHPRIGCYSCFEKLFGCSATWSIIEMHVSSYLSQGPGYNAFAEYQSSRGHRSFIRSRFFPPWRTGVGFEDCNPKGTIYYNVNSVASACSNGSSVPSWNLIEIDWQWGIFHSFGAQHGTCS